MPERDTAYNSDRCRESAANGLDNLTFSILSLRMIDQNPHISFSPGSGMQGELELHLKKGLTWMGALQLGTESKKSKQSILTFCDREESALLELFIDREGALVLKNSDKLEARIPKDGLSFDRWAIVRVFAKLLDGRLMLELAFNDELKKASSKYRGAVEIASQTIGDPGGGTGATWRVGEMFVVPRRMPKKELAQATAYLANKWAN
jgi:hypothetical protein